MQVDPQRIVDGFTDLSGGMDSGRSPMLATSANPNGLLPNQTSFNVNCRSRGGRIKPRPGWTRRTLNFDGNPQLEQDFKTGIFQHANAYYPANSPPFIMASIGGAIFRVMLGNYLVQEVTKPTDRNPKNRLQAWMYQADRFLIIQDGQSRPFIFDGSELRRSDPTKNEIQTGTVGIFAQGRIWYALPNGTTFRATDLIYGNGNASDVLRETENDFLNEGGDFGTAGFTVPSNAAQITAMRQLANLDVALGQGPILVFTPNMIFSLNAPVDRTLWKDLQYPIQTVSLINYGALSQNSTVSVNGDFFYRSIDGVRSFVLARRDFQTWGNTPVSTEVEQVLANDSTEYLGYSSAVLFDNRLIMTCSPVFTARGVVHRGLAVLDFQSISGITRKAPPAWDGMWVGLNILQILKVHYSGKDRCFMFAQNSSGEIELWELSEEDRFDNGNERISWSFETASYPFQNPFEQKKLWAGDTWIDRAAGECEINMRYRPDQHHCWLQWHTCRWCAEYCWTPSDDPLKCKTPKEYKEQYRPRLGFPQPEDVCNAIAGMPPYRLGYQFQFRFECVGFFEVIQGRFITHRIQEAPFN